MVGYCRADDRALAAIDRQQFPQAEWIHYYYFSVEHIAAERRPQVVAALNFCCASCSTQQVVERCLPQQVGETLYRIDCRQLGWDQLGAVLATEYPYRRHGSTSPPLVVAADWFVQAALDQTQSKLYFTLLYGRVLEKQDEFLEFLGTSDDTEYRAGVIEENSGVSVAKIRLLEARPTSQRIDTWITYDSAEITVESDPLQHLDNQFKFDAGEIIGGLPKVSAKTGDRGHLQVYALTNAAGEIQDKAPTDIVVDHSGVRGVEIRNPISCVICHAGGLNKPKTNGLRRLIESGVDVYAKDYEAIERFHLGSLDKLIDRHNEDFGLIVTATTGLTPEETAAAVRQTVQAYDADVTLDAAAGYFATTADEMAQAIAYASEYDKELPVRLVSLAHGEAMRRTVFAQTYPDLYEALEQWNSR